MDMLKYTPHQLYFNISFHKSQVKPHPLQFLGTALQSTAFLRRIRL
nr:MAG TPA: hypothetical protein [Caudoviricetes sp.]